MPWAITWFTLMIAFTFKVNLSRRLKRVLQQVFGHFFLALILKLEISLLVKALRFRLHAILLYSCPGVGDEGIHWPNSSDSLPSRIPNFELNAKRLSPWTFRAEGIEPLIHAESVDESLDAPCWWSIIGGRVLIRMQGIISSPRPPKNQRFHFDSSEIFYNFQLLSLILSTHKAKYLEPSYGLSRGMITAWHWWTTQLANKWQTKMQHTRLLWCAVFTVINRLILHHHPPSHPTSSDRQVECVEIVYDVNLTNLF